MEKLGLAAKLGVKRVFRQAIFGGNYALLDKKLDPLPVRYKIPILRFTLLKFSILRITG